MAGELCGPGCGYCGRCDPPGEEPEDLRCTYCGEPFPEVEYDPYCSEECAAQAAAENQHEDE